MFYLGGIADSSFKASSSLHCLIREIFALFIDLLHFGRFREKSSFVVDLL
jgi:hypothetical protein